ncbi:MAG: hypothetical protein ABII82_13220, partial [Verrucomicrobiota bacterium]
NVSAPRSEVMVQGSRNRHGLRSGDWKLITAQNGDDTTRDELYNLVEDPAETVSLIEKFPEKAAQLRERMTELLAAPSTRPH